VDTGSTDLEAHAESISLGQHEVEHDDVERRLERGGETSFAVVTLLDVETLIAQEIRNRLSQAHVVLHDQDSARDIAHCK
jgi:hypothetical protein